MSARQSHAHGPTDRGSNIEILLEIGRHVDGEATAGARLGSHAGDRRLTGDGGSGELPGGTRADGRENGIYGGHCLREELGKVGELVGGLGSEGGSRW